MESLTVGDLRIEATDERPAQPLQLVWKGRSNERHPGRILAPYFASVLVTADRAKVPIEMHFENLEHMNSSTITSIIQVIQESRARQIPLVIVYDQALKWQKLSFEALRMFAKDNPLLELRPKS